jgi:hypothetical protein
MRKEHLLEYGTSSRNLDNTADIIFLRSGGADLDFRPGQVRQKTLRCWLRLDGQNCRCGYRFLCGSHPYLIVPLSFKDPPTIVTAARFTASQLAAAESVIVWVAGKCSKSVLHTTRALANDLEKFDGTN